MKRSMITKPPIQFPSNSIKRGKHLNFLKVDNNSLGTQTLFTTVQFVGP